MGRMVSRDGDLGAEGCDLTWANTIPYGEFT